MATIISRCKGPLFEGSRLMVFSRPEPQSEKAMGWGPLTSSPLDREAHCGPGPSLKGWRPERKGVAVAMGLGVPARGVLSGLSGQ